MHFFCLLTLFIGLIGIIALHENEYSMTVSTRYCRTVSTRYCTVFHGTHTVSVFFITQSM